MGREQSSLLSHSQVKMGTEGWVLKGTKLIINTKKQRLKIQRLDFQKFNIKEKKKKKMSQKLFKKYIYIYEVCFKNKAFFSR